MANTVGGWSVVCACVQLTADMLVGQSVHSSIRRGLSVGA